MKIDAGLLKNFKLKVTPQNKLRPTKSRIRNSLFDVLNSRICFADYLFFDLFAGTGAVGIEALNRGFEKSFFFENDTQIFSALKENLAKLPKTLNFELYFGNNLSSFQNLKFNKIPKIFFIDAPFHLDLELDWLGRLQKEKDCFLIIEKDKDLSHLFAQKFITPIWLKKYGKIYLHFFQF